MTPLSAARIEATTESLYALLPAHIRSVDVANGEALKSLFAVLAAGSSEIDREIEVLYDSQFIETAPEAALPDLAALIAAEPLRPLPAGSGHNVRAFIANTLHYRRGKGTARVLEALATDVGGFGAVVVEYFMRLARAQNLIDVRVERPSTAYLIPGTTSARVATGFDTLSRLVDVRSIARLGGRHHVPNVGIHILRPVVPFFAPSPGIDLSASDLALVPLARPWPGGSVQRPGYFQLSAHPGRVLRLFNPDRRSRDGTGRATDTHLPDRLRRLALHLETEELRKAKLGRPSAVDATPWFDESGNPFTIYLRRTGSKTFTRVKPDEIQIANFDATPIPAGARPAPTKSYSWFTGGTPAPTPHKVDCPISCAFDPVTGRLIVAQPITGAPDTEEVRIAYGSGIGRAIGAGPQDRNAADVPFDITDTKDQVNFVRVVDSTQPETGTAGDNVRPVQTLAKALDEWAANGVGKRGLVILTRCDREGAAPGASNIPVAVHPDSELHIVSAQWRPKVSKPGVADNPQRRGYVVRRSLRFTIDAPLRVTASAAPPASGRAGVLVLDGLQLTAGLSLGVRAVTRLLVRHSTLRAPGSSAISTTAPLEGANISIDSAILGRINLDFGSKPATGVLSINDSIVSADAADGSPSAAIVAASLDANLTNVTLLGTSSFKSLEATNVIFGASSDVTRHQSGCVRYSSIASGSTMPRRFRCQPDLARAAATERKRAALSPLEQQTIDLNVQPIFLDTALDEPTVAMLHPLTSDAIRLGGENNSEMGVFSASGEGLRMANVVSLFADYVPFGLEAGLIDDTRSSAVATRRNRP
jgi:hypothetical protein